LILTLGALALPALAVASGEEAILDCSEDDRLDGSYTRSELRSALDNLPTDLDEYSSCREVFNSALANLSGGGPDSRASRDGQNRSAEETARMADDARELDEMTKKGGQPGAIRVGGERVSPGSDGMFDVASSSNGIPLPLLLALIGLGVLTLAGGFVALRSRVPLLARIPLPSLGRHPRRRT
jgi:hypothetical protein